MIHSSAVIEDGATIGKNVRIGPFCHVGPHVTIGDDSELLGQCSVQGHTTLGARTRIFPFASVGSEPQDLKFDGEHVTLVVGDGCTIREGVTMNPGTSQGGKTTVVGDNCLFLANSHVAHDCQLGSGVILSNNVMLGGHCTIGDHVIFGGGSGCHQFTRIGNNAFIGGLTGVGSDLIPYGMAIGNRAWLAGLNIIGMKRGGMSRETIHVVRNAYKALFDTENPVLQNALALKAEAKDEQVIKMLDFVLADKDRSLLTPASKAG